MFELTELTAPDYLDARGFPPVRVESLGGGVSNQVLLVETGGLRLVLKQALPKLRVDEDWFSDRTRTLRECQAILALEPLLPPGAVPAVLFMDEENCVYAMAAAPPDARDWKSLLLGDKVDPLVAQRVGEILAKMMRATWLSPDWSDQFGDQSVFDQLRLDPYYRFTATRHPDLAGYFNERIEHCRNRRVSLVHGDWSPKNLLVSSAPFNVMAIDFEVVHFGDPSFDIAFLLNHFLLKMFYFPERRAALADCATTFWRTVRGSANPDWLEESTIRHLGCLLLARIDGKSPAEYIRTPELRDAVRRRARGLILSPPATVDEVFK